MPGARSPEPGARSPEPGARSPEPGARSPKAEGRRHFSTIARLVEDRQTEILAFASSVAPRLVGSDAQDIVQDALLLVLKSTREWPSGDPEALAIVMGYVKNVARNRLQKARIRRHVPIENHDIGVDCEPWLEASRIKLREVIHAAFAGLTEGEREVAAMCLLLDMSLSDVADERDCSANTVKELLRRARLKLRAHISGHQTRWTELGA